MRGIGAKLQITKWWTGQQSLKEKEIKVLVEIVQKKLEGYVIKNYLYLINLKVSITISTDSRTTDGQHYGKNCGPTVG